MFVEISCDRNLDEADLPVEKERTFFFAPQLLVCAKEAGVQTLVAQEAGAQTPVTHLGRELMPFESH